MKNLKIILATAILLFGFQSFAQTIVDGMYNSTFGKVNLSVEEDKEFPNGSLIYGDYRENGTISGYYADFRKEIKGSFFNGSSEGKFIFMMPFAMSANTPVESMNGFWGYTSDNKNSSSQGDKWNITSRTGNAINIKNVTNVWSGKWNTTDGDMHLVQLGNKITGRYKGLGTVTATYDSSSRFLKGTFLNQKNNRKGYIEFYFEGNTFKGKWGWNAAMTEGNWDGTKSVKNNKELSKMVVASVPSTTNSNSVTSKYAISVKQITTASKIGYPPGNELYGFGGIRVFRVTNSGREEIKSFGNKVANFFDRTENNSFPDSKSEYTFPNTPEYTREYTINNSDLNNDDVDIEVEIYHHLKLKTRVVNDDYKYVKQTLKLERMIALSEIMVGKSCENGVSKNYENSDMTLTIKKIN